MIKEIPMYTVLCDNCKCDVNSGSEYAAWGDSEHSEDMAIDSDWHKVEEPEGVPDKHYCPDCYSIGENDELIIIAARTKT